LLWPPRSFFEVGPSLLISTSLVLISLACWPQSVLGLDGARLPKEAIFAATSCALACVNTRAKSSTLSPVDLWFIAFLALSIVSISQSANVSVSGRAIVISIASYLFFVGARGADSELAQLTLILGIATAGACAALAILMELRGLIPRLSMEHRGFGGTFLHRNHASHFMICTLPATYWLAMSRWPSTRWLGVVEGGLVAAAVVVTRTRAAWWAFSISLAILCVLGVRLATSDVARKECTKSNFPFSVWIAGLLVGALLGWTQLTRATWTEANPLRTTLSTMLEVESGSGFGRLVQYRNSSEMVFDHWFTGVGPGNWTFNYPRYASPSDPSLLTGLKPVDDLPLSDWLGIASERGIPALFAIIGLFCCLAFRTRGNTDQSAIALLALIAAVVVLGLLDAVILNAAPSAIIFVQFGVYAGRESALHERWLPLRSRGVAFALCGLLVLFMPGEISLIRSNAALRDVVSESTLRRAITLQADNYTAQVLLGSMLIRESRCDEARPHLLQAIRLQPFASLPRVLLDNCRA
jgi:putative inorganic carbon (HCO3(-)) transporter